MADAKDTPISQKYVHFDCWTICEISYVHLKKSKKNLDFFSDFFIFFLEKMQKKIRKKYQRAPC